MTHYGPRVVVIVLNWCREDLTRKCLQSLEASSFRPAETLLVDNGSEDGSGERLHREFPDVSFIQTGSNLGYAGGNNRGIEWALAKDAEYILVLNNDTEMDTECLGLLTDTLRTGHRIGGVAPRVMYHSDPERVWYGGGYFSRMRGLGVHRAGDAVPAPVGDPEEVTFISGCCCLLDAAALRDIGFFDESFFAYVEDVDLSLRLMRAGYRLMYDPRASVLHHTERADVPPTPFQIRQRDRNRRRLMRKHFGTIARMPFGFWFFITRALLLARFAVTGDRPRARAILSGMFGKIR